MESLWQDVRFGLRVLGKSPGLEAIAVLTFSFGTSANTAIVSVVNASLFRPIPVQNADRLTVIAVQPNPDSDLPVVSDPEYQDYREQSDAFIDMSAYSLNLVELGTAGHSDRLIASFVTSIG